MEWQNLEDDKMTDTIEGATQESNTATNSLVEVPIHELSDEELAAVREGRIGNVEDSADEIDEDNQDNLEEPNAEKPQDKKESVSREEYEALLNQLKEKEQDLGKQQKHIKNLERYNAQRGNEIGQLRKALAQKIQTTHNKLQSTVLTADEEFDARLELKEAEKKFDSLTEEQQFIEEQTKTAQAVAQYFPEELPMEDIVGVLRSDGFDDGLIREFIENPFATEAGVLINLAKRAQERKIAIEKNTKMYQIAQAAIKRLEELEKKQVNGRDVVKNLNKAIKNSAHLNGESGGSSAGTLTYSLEDVHHLSDAELKSILDSAKK